MAETEGTRGLTQAGGGPRLFSGWFGRIILPAAIFQIVVVGPGFSTGREVVEYAGQFGALGVWSLLVVLIGFAVLCVIGYELARVMRAYDYRQYIRHLIGPAWPLFDVLWVIFILVIVGLVTAAVGTVLESTFGIPALLATIGVLVVVAVVLFFERTMIEGFELVGSILFSAGISIFAIVVLTQRWDEVGRVFATGDVSAAESATVGAALWSGVLYVAYNIPVMVAVLFCLDRQTRRADTVSSGIISAVLVVVPFALTYLALLAFYTQGISDEAIPWLVMFDAVGGTGLAVLFALVFTYAVVDTSVAIVHAFLHRIDSALGDVGRGELPRLQRRAVVLGVLVAAFVLSQFGVIALVAQGYTYLAYGFLLVFVLPLIVRGVYLIWEAGRTPDVEAVAPPSASP